MTTNAPETSTKADKAVALPSATIEYLLKSANASFDRFNDLDESVWRSLPFFAAIFGLAATLVSTTLPSLRAFDWSLYSLLGHGLLVLSVASFGWAFRWFTIITRPRSFEYPADERELREYAELLAAFHESQSPSIEERAEFINQDLMLLQATQLGDAARLNGKHAQERLKARSQSLQFAMIGFALALANTFTIYAHDRIYGIDDTKVGVESDVNAAATTGATRAKQRLSTDAPNAAASKRGNSGRGDVETECKGGSAEKGCLVTEQPKQPVQAPTPRPVERPTAPPPQRIERSEPPPARNQ